MLCDEPRFSDEQKDTLPTPTLIIEVFSESTKDYDKGGKFQQYRTIESFVEYLLIAQDMPYVELTRVRGTEAGYFMRPTA